MSYLIGNEVRLTAEIRNESGALANPSQVNVRWKSPSGVLASGAAENLSVGVFVRDIQPGEAGQWAYRFEGVGVVNVAAEGTFEVRASQL